MSAPSAINNARQIIIGNAGVALGATDLTSAAFEAATGEVGVFTKEGVRVNTANSNISAGMEFVIAVSRGAGVSPLVSDVIDGSKVTVASAVAGSAATEQISAVGYNGTSGLIADVATYAGELYKVGVLVHQFMSGTDSEKLKAGYYQSTSTDVQADIALGLTKSLIQNFDREVSNAAGRKPIGFAALCSDAGSLTGNDITVTFGSSVVAYAVAVGVSVGDYLRLGTTQTDDTYKVISISGLNVTLDRPVQVPSQIIAANNAEEITSANGLAANWGVVLVGAALPFSINKQRYAKVRFDVSLSESFGSTAVTSLSNANEGTGTFEAVAQLERFLNGFRGESYEMGEPFIFNVDGDMLATAGSLYGCITLKFSDTRVVSFQNEVSPKELIIAVAAPNAAYVTTATDGLADLLEAIVPASAVLGADLLP